MEYLFLAGARSRLGPNDVRDDFARFLDQHHIADANILARDLARVVQTGPAHRCAGQLYGFQMRHRGEDAGLADLHFDLEELGQRLLRFVLVGDHPARRLARGTQAALLSEVVYLDDHAVGLVGQIMATLGPVGAVLQHRVNTVEPGGVGIEREAEFAQQLQRFRVRFDQGAFRSSQGISEQAQTPFGRKPRIE